MKILELGLTAIVNDKDELIAVTRRNGHVITYLCKEANNDQFTKLLEQLVASALVTPVKEKDL